eukprot:gnl/TRDRNA2_/TRDRNA2_195166_c0_seq1.p1 gnl/TRDRNA2_/TRDRNA2_195166_c0~~gnl/TRDRNA2_/TRDRNA2_195166_c0_seq1.p1  ORF type:complete len:129 (+),score=15.01 gnl/TRDRNA2_/TRDRNA2_195166_c0_seq1:471-857(+)
MATQNLSFEAGVVVKVQTRGILEAAGKDDAFVRWTEGKADGLAALIPVSAVCRVDAAVPPMKISGALFDRDGRKVSTISTPSTPQKRSLDFSSSASEQKRSRSGEHAGVVSTMHCSSRFGHRSVFSRF